jgi:polyisoprenoid-binding protein YceI
MKKYLWPGVIAALVVLVAGGFWLYDWVLGEPLAASEPISAIPLEIETQTPTATLPPTATAPVEAAATPTPASLPPTATATQPPVELAAGDGLVILAIQPGESEARFYIYEQLNGQDKTVIGVTDQVAGQVAVNPADLSQPQFGPIQVNARTLVTDDSRRNNAIRNRILFTDRYEFVTFTPTAVSGLSGSGAVGGSYTFQVSGDLAIRDVTRPVTFEVTLQAESETRLVGFAAAAIRRSDFDIAVPSVPFVANVGDEITLELDFVLAPLEP